MKREVRVLGVDDAAFDKFKDKEVLVIGCFFRSSKLLEGVLSTKITVDGDDATAKLVGMINSSKFRPQIQAVFLDGVNMAGFNMVDINGLSDAIKKPVIAIVRRRPDVRVIKRTLKSLGWEDKIEILEKAGKVIRHKRIFFQAAGITKELAKEYIDVSTSTADIPESVRIAHIIGAGLSKGESRGRA